MPEQLNHQIDTGSLEVVLGRIIEGQAHQTDMLAEMRTELRQATGESAQLRAQVEVQKAEIIELKAWKAVTEANAAAAKPRWTETGGFVVAMIALAASVGEMIFIAVIH